VPRTPERNTDSVPRVDRGLDRVLRTHDAWLANDAVPRCNRARFKSRLHKRGWLGSTPAGRRPQVRGFRAGGSLAVASSTPATQLSSPAKMITNHGHRPWYEVGPPEGAINVR
jgi:hypothetical protein